MMCGKIEEEIEARSKVFEN